MKGRLAGLTMGAVIFVTLFGATAAHADQTVTWEGNGLDSITRCQQGDTPHLHWVLTPGEMPVEGTTAELFINGKDAGQMTPVGAQGALQLTITFGTNITLEMVEDASVYASITSGSVGDNAVLTISDGCVCSYG